MEQGVCVCVQIVPQTFCIFPNIPYMNSSGKRCVCVWRVGQIVPQAFCIISNTPYTTFRTTQRWLTCSFVGFMPTMTVAHFNR